MIDHGIMVDRLTRIASAFNYAMSSRWHWQYIVMAVHGVSQAACKVKHVKFVLAVHGKDPCSFSFWQEILISTVLLREGKPIRLTWHHFFIVCGIFGIHVSIEIASEKVDLTLCLNPRAGRSKG